MEYKDVLELWEYSPKTPAAARNIYEILKGNVHAGDICYTFVPKIGKVLFEVGSVVTPTPFIAGDIRLYPIVGSSIVLSTYGDHNEHIEGHRLFTDRNMMFLKKDCYVLIGRKYGPDNVLDKHEAVKNAQDIGQKWLDYYNSLDLV